MRDRPLFPLAPYRAVLTANLEVGAKSSGAQTKRRPYTCNQILATDKGKKPSRHEWQRPPPHMPKESGHESSLVHRTGLLAFAPNQLKTSPPQDCVCNSLPNSTRLNNLYSKEREVRTRTVGRSDHPSLSSHRGKLSDPHGHDQETVRLQSPQTGLGSDPPAFLVPILTLLTTSRGKIHRENVITSRRPYSPTGLAICNLQQGSNEGGASLGIIVLKYLSTKLGRFTRPWGIGEQRQTYHP